MKSNILIVDDVQMNREFLKRILEEEYYIYEAENGKKALEILDTSAKRYDQTGTFFAGIREKRIYIKIGRVYYRRGISFHQTALYSGTGSCSNFYQSVMDGFL